MPLLEATQAPEKRLRDRRWVVGLLLVPALILGLLVAPFFRPVSFQVGGICVIVSFDGPGLGSPPGPPQLIREQELPSPHGTLAVPGSNVVYQSEVPREVLGVAAFECAYRVMWFPGRRLR